MTINMIKKAVITVSILAMSLAASFAAQQEKVNPTPRCNDDAVVWQGEMPKNPQAGDIWTNPVDGMEMIFVKKGYFKMGNDQIADEKPYHNVYLKNYWISKFEVTVAQYKKFCEISQHPIAKEPVAKWLDNTPIVNVDWNDATAYAKWANAQLPTEEEWEKAARCSKLIYPWGNIWDPAKCNNGLEGKNAPTKVGSYPAGASEYGVMDMAGNVAEWCSDDFKKEGDVSTYRIIRGGSCVDVTSSAYHSSRRDYLAPSAKVDVIGFRYVMKAR
ncbi:MAG: SUMF1/EgtB/PvdO family nonheme iron enzyme [bacterium]